MLQIFRDKSQSTFIQAIVLVIVLVFVFWGVGANMMDSRDSAIIVNGEEISYQEYQRVYEQILSSFRQQFGGSVPKELLESLGISSQAKNQLIQQALLRQGAAAMGLLVSAPEVQKNIQEMPQFQENETFNIEKYKAILAANRRTPHKYENAMRVDMLSTRAVKSIGNFATTVTDAEINDVFQQVKESIKLHFTKINPATFTEQVTIEEEKLAAWFNENKENYKTEPQIKLKFLSFPYAAEAGEKDSVNETTRSAVFQKANEAYENIISAGSLQEYARLHPDATILETDLFSRLTPPDNIDKAPAVQNKAFSLKEHELSSLIESPNGYSILYAEAIQPPVIPAIDTVRDKVTDDYKAAHAKTLAREKSEEILAKLKSGTSFAEIADSNNLKLQEATLSRSSSAADINNFPTSLLVDVFSLNSSKPFPDEPATVGEDIYLYQFAERQLPDPASMTDEEKERYRSAILSKKQERLLVAWIRHQEKNAEIFSSKNIQ